MSAVNRICLIAAATTLAVVGAAEHRANAQNLNLTATIQSGCTIGTEDLAFGNIDSTNGGSVTGVQLDITGCAFTGTSATVTVDGG